MFTYTEGELDEIKKGLIACWDPFANNKQIISESNTPTQEFLDFFINTERLIKEKQVLVESIHENIDKILEGIDKVEVSDQEVVIDGWWETLIGAEFGASKLNELKEYIDTIVK